MNHMKLRRRHLLYSSPLALLLAGGFQAAQRSATPASDPLIEGFRKTTSSSVADAMDQVLGRRGFMAHDMRPQLPGTIVGRATTALLRPAPPEKATAAVSARHSIEMIDHAQPGQVGVIVIENGLDVAGLGGLMGTTAKERGMAGIVIDGGVRDLAQLRALSLPVYARSVSPASTVGRFASVARDVPVNCAGVTVRPGDIIIADEDGVVAVPAEKAEAVLKRALEIDQREAKMFPLIKQYKSLQKVVEMFNRI